MGVIENHVFRLRVGVAEATFLEADRAVQTEFFNLQRDAGRRTTARGSGGTWLVAELWGSPAGADAAAATAHPAKDAFAALIETRSLERFDALEG